MTESNERETRSRAAVRDANSPASTSAAKDNGGAQAKVEDQVKTEAEAEEPVLKSEALEEVNDGGDAVMTDDQSGKGQEQSAGEQTVAESSLEPATGDNTAGTAVAIDASFVDSSNATQGSAQEQTSTQIQPQAQNDAPVANVNNPGTTEAEMAAVDAVFGEDGGPLSDCTDFETKFKSEIDAENKPGDDKEKMASAQNEDEDEAIDELLTEIAETQSQGKTESQPAVKLEETEPLPSAPSKREPASLKRSLEDTTLASSSQPNAGKKQRTDQKVLPKSKAHAAQSKDNETKQARTANGNDETFSLLEDTTRTIEQVQKVLAELQARIDTTKSSLKEVATGIR
ncbi:uncharacterized protein BDV14DRAFT_175035 [Aspergillus stella-maris]|uniref:uncharacterized protein n=1 Tax=Aspergillus stella-maris TaxID=1810926 RepID=UPI003CCCAF98